MILIKPENNIIFMSRKICRKLINPNLCLIHEMNGVNQVNTSKSSDNECMVDDVDENER